MVVFISRSVRKIVGRTVVEWTSNQNIWPLVDEWAEQAGYHVVEQGQSSNLYQKRNLGTPLQMVKVMSCPGSNRIEAWVGLTRTRKAVTLGLIPEELAVDAGGIYGSLARRRTRDDVDSLLHSLGAPIEPLAEKTRVEKNPVPANAPYTNSSEFDSYYKRLRRNYKIVVVPACVLPVSLIVLGFAFGIITIVFVGLIAVSMSMIVMVLANQWVRKTMEIDETVSGADVITIRMFPWGAFAAMFVLGQADKKAKEIEEYFLAREHPVDSDYDTAYYLIHGVHPKHE
jgi:hypothetical protein